MTENAEKTEMWLQVKMPDGAWWEVPARIVADDRASYYAGKEDPGHQTGVYEDEFDFTMTDDFELEDWAAGNMDWSDVAEHARKVGDQPDADYQEGWVNGDKRRVEHPVED